jgi:hypothetical protein
MVLGLIIMLGEISHYAVFPTSCHLTPLRPISCTSYIFFQLGPVLIRCGQHVPLNCSYLSTRLHWVTNQNPVNLIIWIYS